MTHHKNRYRRFASLNSNDSRKVKLRRTNPGQERESADREIRQLRLDVKLLKRKLKNFPQSQTEEIKLESRLLRVITLC